jgi:uncharacterized protein
MITLRDGLEVDEDRLVEICRRYGIAELALFGSVLRNDFGPKSDIDLLYVLHPGTRLGLRFLDAVDELSSLFGRPVDLVSKHDLHWYVRDEVLSAMRPLHVAA